MKLMIDIPEELYETWKGRPPMLGDEGMDMVAQAIANGTPIQTVTNAEEAEAYPIISKEQQEENGRIIREFLRDVAQAKELPECKECRTCKHCTMNKKNRNCQKITWENGYPFIFCARHHEHFAPNDTCEFWEKERSNEINSKSDR
jgi:hypothetical protein